MLDWVIVGGGPHGVHQAIRLIGHARINPKKIRIVDPGPQLLHTWHRCTTNTGMTHLRSPSVHHLDLDPFSLNDFAKTPEARGLQSKAFVRPYNRPSVPLFRAHCAKVMARYGLRDLHLQTRVSRVALRDDGVRLSLNDGEPLHAHRVLLAVGASEQPRRPAWSDALPPGTVQHIFQAGFELDPESFPERVAVIGGGITGAQSALKLANAGKRVTLVTRHELRKHQFDSDPGWAGPKSMTRFSKTQDPAARRRMIGKARHLGSMPPDIHRRLRYAIDAGRIEWLRGEVTTADTLGEALQLTIAGRRLTVDRLLLATGFKPQRPGGALVDDLAETAALQCGTCGFPIVDRHLRWHPRVFVTGPLAELEIGPVARNLIGARRAAERIAPFAKKAL